MSLSWIPEKLRPVVYRLSRADGCAYELLELMMSWSMNEPVQLTEIPHNDREVKVVVRRVRPIPPLVALLFSEAINHLRASLDNVVWHIVEDELGSISPKKAPRVAFPITDGPGRFENWQKQRLNDGFTPFGDDHWLGNRLRSLQPFSDTTQEVESFSGFLTSALGENRAVQHPLTLLQAYSNEDKHRQLRLGVSRSSISPSALISSRPDFEFRELRPGDEVGKFLSGKPFVLEAQNAVMIRRPGDEKVWANPARELNALRQYVADVAIPILVKGLELPGMIPPGMGLDDNDLEFEDRVLAATGINAIERFEPRRQEQWHQANMAPPKPV